MDSTFVEASREELHCVTNIDDLENFGFYVTADRAGDLAIHCRKIDASPTWTTHMYERRSAGYG
jgi:hypothetical protein